MLKSNIKTAFDLTPNVKIIKEIADWEEMFTDNKQTNQCFHLL